MQKNDTNNGENTSIPCGTFHSPYYTTNVFVGDRIDVWDLWMILLRRKKMIFTLTGLFFLGSLLYVLLVIPTYESKAYLLPPKDEKIQPLNQLKVVLDSDSVTTYSKESVYQVYLTFLQSKQNLREAIDQLKLEKYNHQGTDNYSLNDFVEDLSKSEKLEQVDKKQNSGYYKFTFAYAYPPEVVFKITQFLVKNARKLTKEQITRAFLQERNIYIRSIEDKIKALRKLAKDRRLDRIAKLEENIKIARKLNLKKPSVVGPKANIQGVEAQGLPLYYLGYDLLEAEKTVLEKRKNDDPFIPGLRNLQEKLYALQEVQLDKDFDVFTLDQAPSKPIKPIKPRKIMIISVSTVTGLLLAIFLALLIGFAKGEGVVKDENLSSSS